MSRITRKAYAKINLSLDVLHKRDDGYHEVCMLMHQIDLHDDISIEITENTSGKKAESAADADNCGNNGLEDMRSNKGESQKPYSIILTCSDPSIPTDHRNIAYKAAEAVLDIYYGQDYGQNAEKDHSQNVKKQHSRHSKHHYEQKDIKVHIHIEKNIPVAAGLAGGSSDAAAVMLGLNELLDMGIVMDELMRVGKKIGADVPFCLLGGCVLAEGIGERLTPLSGINTKLLLSKPPIEVSTAQVYGKLKADRIKNHPNTKTLLCDLKTYQKACAQSKETMPDSTYEKPESEQKQTKAATKEAEAKQKHPESEQKRENITEARNKMYKNMINVLEDVALKNHPEIIHTKEKMQELFAEHVMMSGSGPSVFAFFEDEKSLQNAYEKMSKINKETFIINTIKSDTAWK